MSEERTGITWKDICIISISIVSLWFSTYAEDRAKSAERRAISAEDRAIKADDMAIRAENRAIRAEDRVVRLYQAQQISDIQVTPISFETYFRPEKVNEMGRFYFKLINYTGFKASNVKVDAKFTEEWIKEWIINAAKGLQKMKDRGEFLSQDLEEQLKSYKLDSLQIPFELEPNAFKDIGPFQGVFQYQQGKENKLIIRVSWDNENKAHFDKFYFFRIERSEAYGSQSYILIPVLS